MTCFCCHELNDVAYDGGACVIAVDVVEGATGATAV